MNIWDYCFRNNNNPAAQIAQKNLKSLWLSVLCCLNHLHHTQRNPDQIRNKTIYEPGATQVMVVQYPQLPS